MNTSVKDFLVILALFVLFIGPVAVGIWFGARWIARDTAACEARGGVYAHTPHGYRCVRPMPEPPPHALR